MFCSVNDAHVRSCGLCGSGDESADRACLSFTERSVAIIFLIGKLFAVR